MDELLKAAAEAKGMPESLVKRSAEARAKAEGTTTEAVLAEWAGVEAPAADAAVATPGEEQAAERAVDAVEAQAGAEVEEAETQDAGPRVEVLEPTAPVPSAESAADVDQATDTAGVEVSVVSGKKRYPVWLTAMFVIVPLIAVLYIVTVPNGPECGSAGQLLTDPVTGEAVGCDGAPYGVDVVDNFSIGQALYSTNCVACHGEGGGGGAGPALAGGSVLATFPAGSCADHVLWVTLGSAGWVDQVGPTYGATDKQVGGTGVPMPGFGSLSETELTQVTLYERVAFGEEDLAEAETDCGLTEGGDGEATALGS